MNTNNTVNLAPYSAAAEAEKAGDFATAARLYKQAGNEAGGHTKARQCYALAEKCARLAKAL
jgi:hypothetical protein